MRFKRILFALIAALCAVFFIVLGSIVYGAVHYRAQKSDCIVILGCMVYGNVPSPFLKARTLEGLRLYKSGTAPYIIVSGARGKGEDITEAEAMKKLLISEGVPEDRIIKEEKSSNTWQNIFNSKAIMMSKGFSSAVIVSNSFHLKRAEVIASQLNIKASFSGVFLERQFPHEAYGFLREVPAILKQYFWNYNN